MKLDCYLVPSEITAALLKGKDIIIIDVLRSCTTIAYAFLNGAEKVIPAATVEAATNLMSSLDKGSTLLCGERDGRKVKGFDLGNSPLEYTREVVGQKTLVFASTNGTKIMTRELRTEEQFLCSFVNVGEVAGRVRPETQELAVICAGSNGQFSLEDSICAGMVSSRILQMYPGEWQLNDGARAAVSLFEKFGTDIYPVLLDSSHGTYLRSLGFDLDIELCSRVDSVPIAPILKEGRITLSRDSQT